MIDKKKTKKPSLLLPLAAAVGLTAGGGAAYWFFTRQTVGPAELPVGAEVIPQDALMTISVATDPGQWQQLREFGTPQSQAALNKNLADWRDRLLTANGLDYEKDVQPWVGREVTLALLSPPSPAATPPSNLPVPVSQQQVTVMVLPVQNPDRAKQILQQPRTPAGGTLVERTYKGFQIKETQGTARNYSATLLDNRFVVLTTDPKATDRVIDTYKGSEGATALTATAGLTQALSKIQTPQPFGKIYVNLPAAALMTSATTGRPVSPQNLSQIQQNQGLAATIALEPEGIRLRSISWLKPDSQRKYEVRNTAKTMPGRLPAETILMASGGNLKKFWQEYTQGAATNPISPINPEALRTGLKSTIGMDLEQDFLTWMEGEFALSLVAAPKGGSPGLPFSLLFMVQASDRRAAENSLQQLDQAMATKYKFKVEESKIGNQSVTNWVFPAGGPSITHGWMDEDVAFLTLGAPLAAAIVPRPTTPLADSEAFKRAVPAEPNPNNGHFFINMDRALNARSLPLIPLPPANRELVAAIRSIGVTAAINDERSARYDVFVALQKAGKPAALPNPTAPGASPAPEEQNNPALVIPPAPSPDVSPN
jgi:hypothetical protein